MPASIQLPALTLVLALGAVLLGAAPSAAQTPGSCDGIADYADELVTSGFALTRQTPLGDGFDEVEIAFEIRNLDVGAFASATAAPRIDDPALGIRAGSLRPATFPAIAANGVVAAPVQTLQLQLPSASVADLMARLAAGELPWNVHADEQTVLAPGVEVHAWTASEDAFYALARDGFTPPVNPDPGPPPYTPGQEFAMVLLAPADGVPSVLDAYSPGDEFFLVVEDHVPTEIPEALHHVRVLEVTRSDEDGTGMDASDGVTIWTARVRRTDTELLPALFTSASFCTGSSTHIDLPVHASRLTEIDREVPEDEDRDGKTQGIRFNDLPLAGADVTLSGQIAGHVLRPSLELRLRAGQVRAVVDIDTDLSLTAELRAEVEHELDPDPISLYDLCFPLPDLVAGPVPIGMNLQLEHVVEAEGSLTAGAVVGLHKRFEGGFTIGYDARRPDGDRYFSEPHHAEPHPVEFTPPQLLDSTSAHAQVSTEIRTTLRVGARYPLCDTGAGAYLGARGYLGLDVTPTQSPWWSVGHGAELLAGLELQILGLEIASHETGIELFPGADSLDSGSVGAGGALLRSFGPQSSGEDQRWSVAIDDVAVPDGVDVTSVAAFPDGGAALVASQPIGGRNPLLRLDRFGALEWSLQYDGFHQPRRVQVPDGGTILIGGSNAWLARHDGDGQLLWSLDADLGRPELAHARCVLHDFVALEVAPGVREYVVVGLMGSSDVREHDACAFRVDEAGTVHWAKIYEEAGGQVFNDALLASDGTIAVVGDTQTGLDAFSENNPLVAKLDPSDGSVIWARRLPMRRGAHLNAVAEDADGTLFAVGAASRSIRQTGAALLVRIGPDGEDPRHGLMLQDEVWETWLDFEAFEDTAGGDTAYDELFDILPAPGGFVVAGRTGLGVDAAAWIAKIDRGLGLEWFTTVDGPSADALDALAALPDGYLASGFSASLPQPGGGSGDSQIWLTKLPFTGRPTFDSSSDLVSRFLAPGLSDSSADPDIVVDGIVSIDAPLEVSDAIVVGVGPVADLLDDPRDYCVARLTETGRPSLADACADPLDRDEDGLPDARDLCPDWPGGELDSDANGIGDDCECGDQNLDGTVNVADVIAIQAALFDPAQATPLCDTNDDGLCDVSDVLGANAKIFGAPAYCERWPEP